MASKESITKPPRYKVETIGPRFALIDWETGDLKHCPVGTTRGQAENECAALNGAGFAKTPRDAPSHERRFKRGELITFEEIDERDRLLAAVRHPTSGPLDPEIYGHLRAGRLRMEQQKRRELIAAVERWLPGTLTAWGAKVAEGHGYGVERRKAWPTDQILCLRSDAIEDVLVAHFVSVEPSHVKARYFGIEKRAYLNKVKAALQRLARWYVRQLVDDSLPAAFSSAGWGTWTDRIEMEEGWEAGRREPAPARRSRRSSRQLADAQNAFKRTEMPYEARIAAQKASIRTRTFPPDQPRNGVTPRRRHDH